MAKKTPDQMQQDAQDYDAAYDEDMQMPAEQSDDEAFGLMPEAVSEEDDFPSSPEEAEIVEDEPVVEPAAEAPAIEAPNDVPAIDTAKEVQRLKSWEGRLKAMEAQLKAAKPEDKSESIEVAPASEPLTDMDSIKQAIAADFGEEFTKMLCALIDAKVGQANETVAKSVDEIIADIVDTKAKAHFEAIADKHPDFMEIADSPEFAEYLNAMSEEDKAKSQQIVESGSAREINALLTAYKATKAQPTEAQEPPVPMGEDDIDTDLMDAAEGVRSSGMRLPTQPASSADYASAWDEFRD